MDAIGVRYFGFRNLCKSMAGQAPAIIGRIDDYPWASPFFYYWRGRRVPDISNAQAIKVALK